MKQAFLVVEDYGMWAYIIAASKNEIVAKFPHVEVLDQPPTWMPAEEVRRIAERMTLELDEAEAYFRTT